ncbi:hypothetical protein [Azospirillum sp.]|uniref:hypothetical protein n=1 Tax=Azospirillum sp. TaxID=34012 RepID=UPI002D6B9F40|nr:hypothetical protein [Azospirillum sp.]HYD70320.1 hypothetical protein [Azospirillum sp.]
MHDDEEIITRWVIEGVLDHLEEARRFAGLDANAVVALADARTRRWELEGRLIYPSYFCPSSTGWLKALSAMVMRGRTFRILVEEVTPDESEDGEVVRSVARLFPKMDEEMLGLLRAFSAADAERVSDLSDRIATAFRRLREESSITDF